MTFTMPRMCSINYVPKKQNNADYLLYWKDELEKMSSVHILHWAVDSFYPRLALKTAFEPEGCVILAMLSKIVPRITIVCNEMDYQMQHFWNINHRLSIKTAVEIIPAHFLDPENLCFDALLDGTRRRGQPGIGVLRTDQSTGLPMIAPLVRWSHDALIRKLKQDTPFENSYIDILMQE